MIDGFQQWASSERLIQSSPVEQFNGRCVAIDADYYVRKLLTEGDTKEQLLPALGGLPFSLEKTLSDHIQSFKDAGIKPLFVFNGLIRQGERRKGENTRALSRSIDRAWDLYTGTPPDPDRAVKEFGEAIGFSFDHVSRYAQDIFYRQRVPFLVAPYSAHAQMAHMEGEDVDAIYGPPELLLYTVDRLILELDFKTDRAEWINRQSCIDVLAQGNVSMWIDACLLAGCDLLPTLPQVENDAQTTTRPPKLRAAADLLKRSSLTGNQLCLQYSEDPQSHGPEYLSDYRKTVMSIQHQVITAHNGELLVMNHDRAPNDVHALIGQRLPEEIYFYVSRGLIGTRVLSWRTSGVIEELPPIDGGKSITYETLVRREILPQRTKALRLLSQSLHRFYQHKDVELQLFFDKESRRKLGITDAGDIKATIAGWQVRQPIIADRMKALKAEAASLTFAIQALESPDFVKSTRESRSEGTKELKDPQEVQSNALWKYLRLQDYITPAHELSPIGKALNEAYTAAYSKGLKEADFAEPILLGIEMLRLKLLNTDNLFPNPPYAGAPYGGNPEDQRHNMLVTRVACLGRLRHKAVGYSGPLSRHVLAFRSLITVVQRSQRDLLDMCLCSMLLDGQVDRLMPEHDAKTIGFGLPFLRENDCGLGVVVKTYLDDLASKSGPLTEGIRAKARETGATWFQLIEDYPANLKYAFQLFEVMAVAVRALPSEIVPEATKRDWQQAEKWLEQRA